MAERRFHNLFGAVKFMRRKALHLLQNPRINSFIRNVPQRGMIRRGFYFARWFLVLFAMFVEQKVVGRFLGPLGKLASWLIGAKTMSSMKYAAQDIVTDLYRQGTQPGGSSPHGQSSQQPRPENTNPPPPPPKPQPESAETPKSQPAGSVRIGPVRVKKITPRPKS